MRRNSEPTVAEDDDDDWPMYDISSKNIMEKLSRLMDRMCLHDIEETTRSKRKHLEMEKRQIDMKFACGPNTRRGTILYTFPSKPCCPCKEKFPREEFRLYSNRELMLMVWEEEKEHIKLQYLKESDSDMMQPLRKRLKVDQSQGKKLSKNNSSDVHAPMEPVSTISPLNEEPCLLDTPSSDGSALLRSSCSEEDSCGPNIAEDVPDSDNDDGDLSPLLPLTLPPPSPEGPNQHQIADQVTSDSSIHEANDITDKRGYDQPPYDPVFPDFPGVIDIDEFFSNSYEVDFGLLLSSLENEKEESSMDPFDTPEHSDVVKGQSNDEERGPDTLDDANTNLALGTHHTASDGAAAPRPDDNNEEEKVVHSGVENLSISKRNDGRCEETIAGLSKLASRAKLPRTTDEKCGDSDGLRGADEEKKEGEGRVNNAEDSSKAARSEDNHAEATMGALVRYRAARKEIRINKVQKTSRQFNREAPVTKPRAPPEDIDREEHVPLTSSPTDPTFPGAWLPVFSKPPKDRQ